MLAGQLWDAKPPLAQRVEVSMSAPDRTRCKPSDAATATRAKKTSGQTRKDILAVAGRQFARAGYSAVRLKDIADEVGVTAPLLVRYFGSKEALFREVATDESGPAIVAGLHGPLETLGTRIARLFASYWVDLETAYPALALLRSPDFEESDKLLFDELERRLVRPLSELLPQPDAHLRARLIAAEVLGVFLFAVQAPVDPDFTPPTGDELERLIALHGAALQATIDG